MGKDYLSDLKKISAGFAILVGLVIIASAGISILTGVGPTEALKDAALRVFYPKTAENNGNILLGMLYLVITFLSIGVIYYIAEGIVNFILKSDIKEVIMMIKVKQLKNHIIICGAGRLGMQVCKELSEENRKFIIIEKDSNKAEALSKEGYTVIEGDCLDDETLKKAGIARCKSVMICIGDSAEGIFIILSAKQLNPKVIIASRADSVKTLKKMKQAGADYIVMPEIEGANKMCEYVENI